jgi:hypothetical protein
MEHAPELWLGYGLIAFARVGGAYLVDFPVRPKIVWWLQ